MSPLRYLLGHFCEAFEVARLGLVGGPRRQVVALQARRHGRRATEEAARLGGIEAGEPGRLEVGGAAVGRLDQVGECARQLRRQAGGGLREACPKEAICQFTPFVFIDLRTHVWHMVRKLEPTWHLVLLIAPVGLELLRQALIIRFGEHRLFYLGSP